MTILDKIVERKDTVLLRGSGVNLEKFQVQKLPREIVIPGSFVESKIYGSDQEILEFSTNLYQSLFLGS